MFVQLPNGKTIEISVEDWLSLTDEDLQYINSLNWGEEIANPFFGSVIGHVSYDSYHIHDPSVIESLSNEDIDELKAEFDDGFDEIIDCE